MKNIVQFVFSAGGKTLTIGANEFGIVNYEGLAASEYELETSKRADGRGEKLVKKRILKRNIEIEFEYKYKPNKDTMREYLISFFSPEETGQLAVRRGSKTRYIDYEVARFLTKDINIHSRLRCLLEIVCPVPYMMSEQCTQIISTLTGGWKWPFTMPFKMMQYGDLRKNIRNGGHTSTPVEIYFDGPALNPKIVNTRTGEYVRIKKELGAEDTLYINTDFGKKSVEIRNGESVDDGWEYIDLSSSFFWLEPGDNFIEYSSEAEDTRPQGVKVSYRERFYGI